jgi:hypothetical protein
MGIHGPWGSKMPVGCLPEGLEWYEIAGLCDTLVTPWIPHKIWAYDFVLRLLTLQPGWGGCLQGIECMDFGKAAKSSYQISL